MTATFSELLSPYGINSSNVLRNANPAVLYEEALVHENDSAVCSSGALLVSSSE